ncbi:MAG: hypothetical protein PHP59_08550 [Methanofollis sp.]|uniref:hypothetical protein n=1 Tax=Methanofollis sp. TaxID=2052835 RepID=UPI0026224B1F|nr:hypothetical protein [Methanofollis sp.]MDD4255409.1 hypothetical protein [Methanofollis sp.]
MAEIKHLGVFSVAKVSGILYLIIGLIAGLFVALLSLLNLAAPAGAGMATAGFGGAAILIMALLIAVFYGVLGFVFGGLFAWLYNLTAGWIGGIEMEIRE